MTKRKYLLTTGASLLMLAGLGSARAETVTLRALMEDVPETHIIEKLLPEFEKETGIKVEFEKVVYGDMQDKLATQLVSPESYYNLLEVDFLWAGEFPAAGWLVDLKPLAERDKLNLLEDPKLKEAYKAEFNTELKLPETLEDYVQVAKFMKAKAGVAGAAMQSQRGDPNSMEFSNYLFSSGGAYLDADRKVVLDSPEAVKALTIYVDAIKNAAQQGALSATLDDTMRLMCSGEAFSMVTYWWMLPQMDDAEKCPKVSGKVGLSVMPGGHGESGGWGWGIPANTSPESQAAAWTFIKWVQSQKVGVERALDGHAPVSAAVYSDPAVLAKYPFYKQALDVVASGKSFPIFAYSAQYEDVLGTQVSQASGGEITPEAAIKASAKGLEDLLKK